uniref:ABC transporter ATP-binding protein n=1 Tax=Agathobacter sp. TaxID=2021311 RepID=UPI0040577A02
MSKRCIDVTNINMSFGTNKVLRDICLSIECGEIFGLLGPSGAGKTTFIKIITGQLKAESGSCIVLGFDAKSFAKSMYSNFGMVLDNTGLYKRLTCYENMKIFADIYKIPYANIDNILEKVGLKNAKKTIVDKMSKGMRQRLVFARALLHSPRILFLDEPTSGLDPNTAKSIHRIILEEKAKGTTIFLTTHNMQEAYALCDNVALLNEGKIVESGNPKDMCKRYNYKNEVWVETRNGEEKCFCNVPACSNEIAQLFESNQVVSIHSTEPTLETVFLELTGRSLESDEY